MGDYDMTDAERDRVLEEIKKTVGEIHSAIYGDTNGKRGLMTRVAILEECVVPRDKFAIIEDRLNETRKVLGILGVAVLGEVIALIFAILTHTISLGGP